MKLLFQVSFENHCLEINKLLDAIYDNAFTNFGGVSNGYAYLFYYPGSGSQKLIKLSLSSFTYQTFEPYNEVWVDYGVVKGNYLYTINYYCQFLKFNLQDLTEHEVIIEDLNGYCDQLQVVGSTLFVNSIQTKFSFRLSCICIQ